MCGVQVQAPALTDDWVIAIPSLGRVKTFGTKTYSKLIVPHSLQSKVHLFLQTEDDETAYRKAYPELKIVRSPVGLLDTANYIVDYFPVGQKVVLLHDDVTRVFSLNKFVRRADVDDLGGLFDLTFEKMNEHKLNLGGLYPTPNLLSMKGAQESHGEFTTDLSFIHEPITLMINQRIHIDGTKLYKGVEKMDYQRSIFYGQQDGGVFRWNEYCFDSKYNPTKGKSKSGEVGGLGHRNEEEEQKAQDVFYQNYSEFVTRRDKKSFVLGFKKVCTVVVWFELQESIYKGCSA